MHGGALHQRQLFFAAPAALPASTTALCASTASLATSHVVRGSRLRACGKAALLHATAPGLCFSSLDARGRIARHWRSTRRHGGKTVVRGCVCFDEELH